MRACRQGVIDFSEARLLDVKWWRRANLLIDGMAKEDDLEILRSAMGFHLALVSNGNLSDESWDKAKTAAAEAFNDIVNTVHPWGARSTEQRRDDEMTALSKLYKERIGDLTDPAFEAVIMAEAARMTAQMEETEARESDEDRIDRMARERILARRQGR